MIYYNSENYLFMNCFLLNHAFEKLNILPENYNITFTKLKF